MTMGIAMCAKILSLYRSDSIFPKVYAVKVIVIDFMTFLVILRYVSTHNSIINFFNILQYLNQHNWKTLTISLFNSPITSNC